MTVEKKLFASQVREGQVVEDLFMVKERNRAETRSGNPYLILSLMDRSGEVAGRLWDNVDAQMSKCEPGNLLHVKALAQTYRGNLQLKIDSIHQLENGEVDLSLFLPSSKMSIDDMARELHSLALRVKNAFFNKLLLKFFDDRSFFNDFQRAPAAKSMHHAYLGGLLEHTLAVAKLAEIIAGFYPSLDRDLLMTGALLHDIGKTEEFTFDTYPFDYTDKGRLMGHLVLGAEMIRERINNLSNFPDDQSTRLQHLVLSHHGRYEFGSPCLPMMSEAFVLNFLDDLDAKLNFIGRLEDQAPETGYQWTDFQRTLERFLFVNGRLHTESEPSGKVVQHDPGENDKHNSKQQQLF
ncbi:MAG: 3'-5' exoribonuclease YhaM family protein [Deltaproteobacteria bacterium]|jgi:3'-5' exoribonuclease|nr:3'-5' exoribonuclease YhaM family protein [Deltaproteobacteria bacterium]